ncbi:MAG TPA: ABC-F family ATP-binding cassette domain-containing protein [Oligoflexus sp.]|uniref:ABC-F family ATP-binding cassette domain-containing protein n=1 Tax=Oligoflexus sp. TaxID=1971216 RepID=UPI002D6EDEDA|nr:ABC-F family ATP-binding cassette domain-containing protein [Oligoflexus sp.]HYX39892.1 ABC-F family ATP-binding cassette domain-containing protein [Oligoflexus sp.]
MLALENLQKNFGSRIVLDHVNYRFPDGEKVALVGANGAGKTTLLNILTGLESADGGRIVTSQNLKLGYLPQEPESNPKETVLADCFAGHREIYELKVRMDAALDALQTESSDELVARYEKAESQFSQAGGYSLEAKASGILHGLGFRADQIHHSPKALSGGWRMRLELAKVFLNDPDVLVLDEPTNHLDLPSLIWVERYLQSFRGTLLFVSHDRALLNRLATVTLHLSHGILKAYRGNFDSLLEQREMEESQMESRRQNLERQREQLETFVDRFGAKASKARQAQSKMKQIAKLRSLESELDPTAGEQTFSLRLPPAPPCGRDVLTVKNLSIGYSKPLATNVNLLMERGARVAIIGSNGIGKSTFLKTISGQIPSLGGEVQTGHAVRLAYFAQNHGEILDLNRTVLENVLSTRADLGDKEGRQILGSFLFSGDDVFKTVKVLSGGEKARVALCRSLLLQSNLLVLDEPTNHLDMSSVEVLIEGLEAYTGTLLFVSHDRTFIEALATHIFVMLPDGRSALFHGKLEDYKRLAAQQGFPDVLDGGETKTKAPQAKAVESKDSNADFEQAKQLKKDRNRLQKAMEKLEIDQHKLKNTMAQVEKKLADLDPNDYVKATDFNRMLQDHTAQLEKLEEEWLETADGLEQVETQLGAMGRLN